MSKKRQQEIEEANDDVMDMNMSSANIINSPSWFDFVYKVMSMETDIDVEELTAKFEDEFVRTRKGDFGKVLSYVPSKYIYQRLNAVLNCRWSFFPMAGHRILDPSPTYNRNDDEYTDSPKYLKVLGVLAIPGLGVQAAYGVKKTLGFTESNDWKAAATDAFKKCCASFGIVADYEIDDDDDASAPVEIDLDEVEYDDDELEEALAVELTFGRFKELTLEEVAEEDVNYLSWLAGNANENSLREAAAIVYKHSESSKKKSRTKSSKKASKASKGSKGKEKSKSESSSKSKSSKSSSKSKGKASKDDDDDERQSLIDSIEEMFEESDEYDTVSIKSLIKSISTSKKYPNGKKKLNELTVKELKALVEVIMEEEDDDDDDDEE